MKKNNLLKIIALTIVIFLAMSETTFARDLTAAGNTATNTAKTIARAISTLGIVCGAILMQIPGLAHHGKRVLASGLIGASAAFGAPALIALLTSIFGNL
jgi:hypothetical protein